MEYFVSRPTPMTTPNHSQYLGLPVFIARTTHQAALIQMSGSNAFIVNQ
jgi:hypothetical protein